LNLQTHISRELWVAIEGPYEAGNYAHAVLEAIHHLTNVLRERSGVDGDGAALVGQALGGDAPKLRVNPLQSESERNVQKGNDQLPRGISLAIRNHGATNNSEILRKMQMRLFILWITSSGF